MPPIRAQAPQIRTFTFERVANGHIAALLSAHQPQGVDMKASSRLTYLRRPLLLGVELYDLPTAQAGGSKRSSEGPSPLQLDNIL